MSVFTRRPPSPSSSPKPPAFSVVRPITAAAAKVAIGERREVERLRMRRDGDASTWQEEAWEYFDLVGEVKFAFGLVGAVSSRVRLYTAFVDDPSSAPTSTRDVDQAAAAGVSPELARAAEAALARLDSAFGGQPGLLRDMAINLSVAGECYLVQTPARAGSKVPESWDVRSTSEVRVTSNGAVAVVSRRDARVTGSRSDDGVTVLPATAFVGRIWRPHPRYSDEADSSMRGVLDPCAELLLLNRTFRATARSRLNAGALYLPDGLSVAAGPDPDVDAESPDSDLMPFGATAEEAEDAFEAELVDAMTTPIRDEDSASAVVPLIIRGPAELGDKIKQFKFERSFDEHLVARADRVLERILQGIDVPKDVVTGLANVRYSNAVVIDETLYKAHIEPLMLLVVDALTVVYLRPALVAAGFSQADAEKVVIWFDPTAVATRSDRAADADSGFDKYAISYEAWRRAHGFSVADAPGPNEVAFRMMVERGGITPDLTEAMLRAVAPEFAAAVRAAAQEASPAPVPPEVENLLNAPAPVTEVPVPAEPAAPIVEPEEIAS